MSSARFYRFLTRLIGLRLGVLRGQKGLQLKEVGAGVDIEQDTRVVDLDRARWVARQQATRPLVARQDDQLRIQLCRKSDGMPPPAPVLGIDHRVIGQLPRHRKQALRTHHRHVAGQDQPARCMGARRHARCERVPHTQRLGSRTVDRGQYDDIADYIRKNNMS